jgi:divalent metal cation (Fe/Co/Zn/Cd) transporter
VGLEAIRQLVSQQAPDASIPGMVVAGLSLLIMPALARAKKRLGPVLGSQAVVSEARQTELCAWMSGVVLAGLAANAIAGWWWADPVAALAIAGVAAYEARRSWLADSLEDTCCG